MSEIQISKAGFPVRIVNALKRVEISTVGNLVRWLLKDPKKAKRINGLGEKSWGAISEGLKSYGIHIISGR